MIGLIPGWKPLKKAIGMKAIKAHLPVNTFNLVALASIKMKSGMTLKEEEEIC